MGTYYNYNCGVCGKHCHKKRVVRCNFCKIQICHSCRREGVCPSHHQQLTPQERSKLMAISGSFFVLIRILHVAFIIALGVTGGMFFSAGGTSILGGIISAVFTIIICVICCNLGDWEDAQMDKVRAPAQRRIIKSNPVMQQVLNKVSDMIGVLTPENPEPIQNIEENFSTFNFLQPKNSQVPAPPSQPVLLPQPAYPPQPNQATASQNPIQTIPSPDRLTETCPSCGKKWPEGVRWCGDCGKFF